MKTRSDAGTLDAAPIGIGSASRDGGSGGFGSRIASTIEDKLPSGSPLADEAPNCGSASSFASCLCTLRELRAASGDTDSTRVARALGALSSGALSCRALLCVASSCDTLSCGALSTAAVTVVATTVVVATTGAIGWYGLGSGLISAGGAVTLAAGAAASGPARAGASTSPASAVSTVAATGSQTGHSRIVGAISRPHSGQIQWNMSLIYTQIRQMPFSHTPYCQESRNLRGDKIPTQGMCQAPPALFRRCIQRRPAKYSTTSAIPNTEA